MRVTMEYGTYLYYPIPIHAGAQAIDGAWYYNGEGPVIIVSNLWGLKVDDDVVIDVGHNLSVTSMQLSRHQSQRRRAYGYIKQ